MDGDSLPVSSFQMQTASGKALLHTMRGTAVNVPGCCKCVGCNQCAFVLSCYHPSLPVDRRRAGSCSWIRPRAATTNLQTSTSLSTSWCVSSGLHGLQCVVIQGFHHGPKDSQADQQAVFELHDLKSLPSLLTIPSSVLSCQPLGVLRSCAGCAEALRSPDHSAVRREDVSPTLPAAPPSGRHASISPCHVNKDSGHGPAWCNSCSRITPGRSA